MGDGAPCLLAWPQKPSPSCCAREGLVSLSPLQLQDRRGSECFWGLSWAWVLAGKRTHPESSGLGAVTPSRTPASLLEAVSHCLEEPELDLLGENP